MANRTFYPCYSYGIGRVYLEARFTCNGASAPATSTIDGSDSISTLAHTGATNIITIGFKDSFYKVISASADFVVSAVAGNYAQVGGFTNEGTATPLVMTVTTWVAAGTVLNDAANTYQVGITLALKNTQTVAGIK